MQSLYGINILASLFERVAKCSSSCFTIDLYSACGVFAALMKLLFDFLFLIILLFMILKWQS